MYCKLVKKIDDNLRSSQICSRSPLSKTYSKDFWTYADIELLNIGYGLVIYDIPDQEPAIIEKIKSDYPPNQGFELWKCEIENILPLPDFRQNIVVINGSAIEDNLEEIFKNPPIKIVPWPDYTAMAKKVRLIEKT